MSEFDRPGSLSRRVWTREQAGRLTVELCQTIEREEGFDDELPRARMFEIAERVIAEMRARGELPPE